MGPEGYFKFLPKFCPCRNVMLMMKLFSLVITLKNVPKIDQGVISAGYPSGFIHFIWHPEGRKSLCIMSLHAPFQIQGHTSESYLGLLHTTTFQENVAIKNAGTSKAPEKKHKDEEGKYQGKATIISKFYKPVGSFCCVNRWHTVEARKKGFLFFFFFLKLWHNKLSRVHLNLTLFFISQIINSTELTNQTCPTGIALTLWKLRDGFWHIPKHPGVAFRNSFRSNDMWGHGLLEHQVSIPQGPTPVPRMSQALGLSQVAWLNN